jgi:signal transduction histidine kinase
MKSSVDLPLLNQIVIKLQSVSRGNEVALLSLDNVPKPYQELVKTVNTVIEQIKTQNQQIQTMIELDHYRLAGLINSMTHGIALFNHTPELIITNNALKKIFKFQTSHTLTLAQLIHQMSQNSADGYGNSSEAPGEAIAEIDQGVWEKTNFFQAIEKVIQKGKTIRYPQISLNKHYYEVYFIPIIEKQQQITGGAIIIHDITTLIEVDHMKTEFVSVASHQLRTPLTSMRLFIEMLLDQQVGDLNRSQKEYLNNLQDSTLRMIRLVNEFLNVSRMESGRIKIEPQMTDLNQFIQEIVQELQVLAKEQKCQLEYIHPEKDMVNIPLDQSLMREVFKNLLTNAIYYSKPGSGQVNITLQQKISQIDSSSPEPESNPQIQSISLDQKPADKTLSSYFPKAYFLVSIQDNGMGIPWEDQPKLFAKFYRADNAIKARPEGSGLGLYLVKLITDAIQGKVWFKSQPNQGTTFYLALPLYGMLPKQGEKSLTD